MQLAKESCVVISWQAELRVHGEGEIDVRPAKLSELGYFWLTIASYLGNAELLMLLHNFSGRLKCGPAARPSGVKSLAQTRSRSLMFTVEILSITQRREIP